MLTVTGSAPSRMLMTLDEIKAAVGVTGSDSDAALRTLGLQISDAVSNACGVVGDGVSIPTLRNEDLLETFRISNRAMSLTLSRRFITEVSSVVIGGVTITADDYELDRSNGVLRYLDGVGREIPFPAGKVSVAYSAGFDEVPEALKFAIRLLIVEAWAANDRDPLLRSESHEGLGSSSFYKSATAADAGWPKAILDALSPYRRMSI